MLGRYSPDINELWTNLDISLNVNIFIIQHSSTQRELRNVVTKQGVVLLSFKNTCLHETTSWAFLSLCLMRYPQMKANSVRNKHK